MKVIKFVIILIFVCVKTFAQTDSALFLIPEKPLRLNRVTSSKAFQIAVVPTVLTSVGLVYMSSNKKFSAIRDNFAPDFHHKYDDYTQYLPAAVMLGLKAGGVKGASSWGKMLTADAFSIAIMAGMTNVLKLATDVRRPDGTGYNSFASGHTATAFMTATMLHKEYGHLSPWYSIGGYAVASATGVSRMLNNKHWISDVMVGAAIGIVSVELGYVFADMIFKREKMPNRYPSNLLVSKNHRPTFIAIYTGLTHNLGSNTTADGRRMVIENGSRVGVEGAWFVNQYVGIGGQFVAATSLIDVADGQSQSALNTLRVATGAYFSYPLSSVWRLGTKALVGGEYVYKPKSEDLFLNLKNANLNLQTGFSVSYLAKRNLGFKLFTDYSYLPSFINNKSSDELTYGVTIDLMF